MASKLLIFVCFQALLLKESLSLPNIINTASLATPLQTNVSKKVMTGTASQLVAPGYNPNWPASAQAVAVVTEIEPQLQVGELSMDGDMQVGGMIKISGTFPVFGNVAVDGALPTYGTAYVDTANMFQNECACI